MVKYFFFILFAAAITLSLTSAATSLQYKRAIGKSQENVEEDNIDDLEDGAEQGDLKGSASYGYGYYGYPLGGYYSGYPYNYGLYGGYYGGYYPYYGGYGFHGHYFR